MSMENRKGLQVIETREVEFHGDRIIGNRVTDSGRETVYVPVKRLCDNLRLDSGGQLQKIKKRRVLARGMELISTPTQTGPQDMACLRYDLIPTWLMLVHPDKVAPELKERLELYQEEAAQVLAAYFLGSGIAVNERRATADDMRLKLAEMELRQAETELERARLDYQAQRSRSVMQLMGKWQNDLRPEERRLLILSANGIEAPKVAWIEATEIAADLSRLLGANVSSSFVGQVAKRVGLQPPAEADENDYAIRHRTAAANGVERRVDQVVYKPAGAQRLAELVERAARVNMAAGRPPNSPKGIDDLMGSVN